MDASPFHPARPTRWIPCFLLLWCWLILSAGPAHAATAQPVTIKELCLMLRGGYTGDEVLRETTGRPLLEPLDASAETSLRAAGADARFIAAFRAAHRTLTDDEAAAARRPPGASPASFDPAAVPPPQDDPRFGQWAAKLRNELVLYRDGGWQRYADSTLAGKQLFALYFAAKDDPRCQQFTPQLVQFYRDFAPKHPPFELLFFSTDPTADALEENVRRNAMPWPVIPFDQLPQFEGLTPLGKQGIPRLLLVDGMGRLILDSFANGKYIGPQHVIDEMTRMANNAAVGVTGAPISNLAPAAPAVPGAAPHWTAGGRPTDPYYVETLLRGKLVALHDGSLLPASNSVLDGKKLFGLYYSSYMSRAGHEFTPELIQFYQRVRQTHPEFEIILISGDSSPFAMDNLMHRDSMPWPAIAYDQIPQIKMVERFLEHAGASRLMIADNTGWIMADYRISVGNNNLPLVLTDLEKVVNNPTVLSGLAPPQTMTPGAGTSIAPLPGSVQ